MHIEPLKIAGAYLLHEVRIEDERGSFVETLRFSVLQQLGLTKPFVQENLSTSALAGTVRGLHFQTPPHAQDKLIRVGRGAVLDVIVDIRAGSPTYGLAEAVELHAEAGRQLLAPAGVAHGFCTLRPNTEVSYKLTSYYAPEAEAGLLWSDPALGIDWPVVPADAIVNGRDRNWPTLAELVTPFRTT